jgi:pantoate--beta-alanine ligase
MKILENKSQLNIFLDSIRSKDNKIALIPTMGSIHKGHASLVKRSKKMGFFTIVSIFINPTQFNDVDDYKKYPRNRKKDVEFLKKINTDLLFLPSIKDLYPSVTKSEKTILDYRNILCDKFRPGHFDGVTSVVNSLFKVVNPNHAFFGEKDFQQLKLIQKIREKNDLKISIHACPSIRMGNGMSFSSRYNNFTLSQSNLFDQSAIKIILNVKVLRKKINNEHIRTIKKELIKLNIKKIDYIEIRNEISLLTTNENRNARLFIAFYIDNIRILDNFILY